MDREQPVVGVAVEEEPLGGHEVQAVECDGQAADEERDRDGDQIEDGDPLVVGRQQPRGNAVIGVEEFFRGISAAGVSDCSAVGVVMGRYSLLSMGGVVVGGGYFSTRFGVLPDSSDLM